MNVEHLADRASRIGRFLSADPDRGQAIDGVAQHIARYWAPRMRRQIFGVLDDLAAGLLQPLVADALRRHREILRPAGGNALPIPPTGESESRGWHRVCENDHAF